MITKKTAYGSGKTYTKDYVEAEFPKIADPTKITTEEMTKLIAFASDMIEDADNTQIGYLKDGYQFKVETSRLQDKSDLGEMKIDEINEEKATVAFKLFNFNAETISKQYPTAQYYKDVETGFGVTTVGGLDHIDNKEKVILFLHKDKMHGDTVVLCIGKNTSGFEAIWKQDSVTPFPVNFEVSPLQLQTATTLWGMSAKRNGSE